jgi:hypothetical protein
VLHIANKSYSKAFTTKPKLRRLAWHKQQTVRNRVFALKESFFPTTDVPYTAAVQRMATLLGLVDDQTVLAYLGRPGYTKYQTIDQTVLYRKSGKIIDKRHYFTHKLPAKKGYIERFEAGYVYVKDDEWWVHWNHKVQLTLPESEELARKFPKKISLS